MRNHTKMSYKCHISPAANIYFVVGCKKSAAMISTNLLGYQKVMW